MQNPVKEINGVVHELTTTAFPDTQRAAVYKYYAPNAGFHHPLTYIEPGVLSRESILGAYQWYRVLSPDVSIRVTNVVYDKPHNVLLLDVEQTFRLFFLPIEPTSQRLLVRLTLKEESGVHRIVWQEDFFHPDDIAGMVFAPAAPVVRFALRAFGTASNICAKASQVLGYWRPQTTGLAGDAYEKHKEPSNGRAKSSYAGHESDGTRPQSRKKGNGKKSKIQESKAQENKAQESKGLGASSDNVDDSSSQGGDRPQSQP